MSMTSAFQRDLETICGTQNILLHESMSAHTTFRVGGPVDYFVVLQSIDHLPKIMALCQTSNVPVRIMGCGSNLLVSDEGLSGVVVRMGSKVSNVEVLDDGVIRAQAGATNAKIARAALDAGLAGFEFAAGIPGSIGGAAIMNAGAYGGELKDVAVEVTCLTPAGEMVSLSREEAQWGYRHSMMGDANYIVCEVCLSLTPDDPFAIKKRMDELAQKRSDKQPLDKPSAGSTFKRPEGYFAGKLIQDAGMQGYQVGGAQVSTKHAGFIVNVGNATARDIRQVISDVADEVQQQFQVELEPEVKLWGF